MVHFEPDAEILLMTSHHLYQGWLSQLTQRKPDYAEPVRLQSGLFRVSETSRDWLRTEPEEVQESGFLPGL